MRRLRKRRFGVLFLLLGAILLGLGLGRGDSLSGFLLLSAGLAYLGLGTSYAGCWPGLLGKTRRGRLLLSSYVFFWPYHVCNYGSLAFFRLLMREAPFNEIVPGLYLGGRLLPWDKSKLQGVAMTSVLDLTSEFSEVEFLRRAPAYLCIPMLDGSAPSQAQLAAGIEFIRERLRSGPVYVHCALGHGRSPTFVIGYLLACRKMASLRAALEFVQSKRPGVKLRAEQLQSLQELNP